MVPPIIHEIEARSALNSVQGMPFRWSLNPYKGCAHACSYCYARAYHSYLDLPPSSFETHLFAKTNIADILRTEIRRPAWQREAIAIGTATDPYQHLEGQYRLTRRCLEAMAEMENPGSLTTKGTLVTRDIDVLSDLAEHTEFVVHVSLISLDRELLRKLEPGAPTPESRLRAMQRLSAAGVPVSVFLAPVLPGITDRPEQLAEVVRAAAEHGTRDIWTGALRLAPGVKEHFIEAIAQQFPSLEPTYRRLYAAGPNAPTGYQLRIEGEVGACRRSEGLPADIREPHAARPAGRRQLALPI
ncbi:MAG: radical SAM protein [Chloroflexi bacterium]|nr:radical SAM protein [Chloroflexota bacterium]